MRQPVIYLLTHDTITMGPDGPTHQAMNAALASVPETPLITRPIPPAPDNMRFKNERDLRVLGKRTDAGDYPALIAQTLMSKNGAQAAPEVADILGQIYAKDPEMGRKARTDLAEVMDPTSMRHLDDAARIRPEAGSLFN